MFTWHTNLRPEPLVIEIEDLLEPRLRLGVCKLLIIIMQ